MWNRGLYVTESYLRKKIFIAFSKRIQYQNKNDIRVLMLAKTHNGLKQNTIYSIPPDSVLVGFTIK